MKWLGDFARWWVAYWWRFIDAATFLLVSSRLERGKFPLNLSQALACSVQIRLGFGAAQYSSNGCPEAGGSDSPGPGVRHTYLH